MKSMNSIKGCILSVTSVVVLMGAATFASKATAGTCELIQPKQRILLSLLNARVAGTSKRINRRKTLIIKKVVSIRSYQNRGRHCRISARVNVKLRRRIRRNASGYINIRGDISVALQGRRLRVCIKNSKITKIRLSRTLRIGERFYRWVANKVLPRNHCFRV